MLQTPWGHSHVQKRIEGIVIAKKDDVYLVYIRGTNKDVHIQSKERIPFGQINQLGIDDNGNYYFL